jgi:hypothetical protein
MMSLKDSVIKSSLKNDAGGVMVDEGTNPCEMDGIQSPIPERDCDGPLNVAPGILAVCAL